MVWKFRQYGLYGIVVSEGYDGSIQAAKRAWSSSVKILRAVPSTIWTRTSDNVINSPVAQRSEPVVIVDVKPDPLTFALSYPPSTRLPSSFSEVPGPSEPQNQDHVRDEMVPASTNVDSNVDPGPSPNPACG